MSGETSAKIAGKYGAFVAAMACVVFSSVDGLAQPYGAIKSTHLQNPLWQQIPSDLTFDQPSEPKDQKLSAPQFDSSKQEADDTEEDTIVPGSNELELKTLKLKNQQLEKENDRLRARMKDKILDTVEARELEDRIEKARRLATNKVKKEAAWEIARARKEAENAWQEVERIRAAAALERELLFELQRRHSPGKNGHDEDQPQPSDARPDGDQKNGSKMKALSAKTTPAKKITLAELAERRRLQRERAEANRNAALQRRKMLLAQRAEAESVEPGKPTRPRHPDVALQKQIDRAVGTIRKRFEEKIDQVGDAEDADKKIEKLKREMAMQIEKLESRLKNRARKDH